MTRPLLLDLFSCAGLVADGYALAGFDVVAVDNDPAALRHNPHSQANADAMRVLAGEPFTTTDGTRWRLSDFDAVHASPPCQIHSATRKLADAQGRGQGRAVDLLGPTLDALAAVDVPWVVENVERSPLRAHPGVAKVCGSAFGLKVQRHRLFAPSPGLVLESTRCNHAGAFDRDPVTGKPRPWGVYYSKGDSIPSGGRTALTDDHAHEVMGVTHRRLPWRFLCEGLPVPYGAWVGRQVLAAVVGPQVSKTA